MLGLGGALWRMAGRRVHGYSSPSRMLKMIGFTIILCVVLVLLLSGCKPPLEGHAIDNTRDTGIYDYEWTRIAPNLERIIDSEWNVVCYRESISKRGISCIPLSQTGVDY